MIGWIVMPHQHLDDITLYYEWHGQEQGEPLVFINGLLADTTAWAFQLPAFTDHFRVLLYDCRGQGKSDKPAGPYPPSDHIQDLLALLDALNVEQPYVVGLSNGGAIAMTFAARHPHRVNRLVLSDTYAAVDDILQAKVAGWLKALETGGPVARFDAAIPWIWGNDFLAKNGPVVEGLRKKAAQGDIDAIRSLIIGSKEHDMHSHLTAITAPTLVMVGEEDLLTPPWYARALAAAIPNASLALIPGAGHAPTIERPILFNALVRAFLTQQKSRGENQ